MILFSGCQSTPKFPLIGHVSPLQQNCYVVYRSSVKVAREYLKRPFFVLHGLSIEGIANENPTFQVLFHQSD